MGEPIAGFVFRYRMSGGAPTIQKLAAADTATYTAGDLLNLESGELDLAVAADTELLGVCLNTVAATTHVTEVEFIADADAVYGVTDANARLQGAVLDLTGATGAQGVTTDSSHTFIVVAPSGATEETLVTFYAAKHWLT